MASKKVNLNFLHLSKFMKPDITVIQELPKVIKAKCYQKTKMTTTKIE
jgi:hypothetical protein